MQETMCPFCLKTVQTDICTHCGRDVHYPGYPGHLPVGYTLRGRSIYVLGAYIGQGGFGITYIALDMTTNQRVAIKEYYPSHCCIRSNSTYIHPSAGQEETFSKGKQHFILEAQMLQSLSDLESVVRVLDYFEENNSAYLVMEYLDGLSLKDHVEKNGKLEAQPFLNQMKPLMADMEKMHRRGVVHRDIAPDNIILLPDGRLKLIDFGAARSYVGDKSMTVVVKKGFAPVEQYMRKGSNASTDVYALAATIYYCITGIVPPDSAERQYGEAELKAPTSIGVELSREQERALEKALEIQPKARTQSVAELAKALDYLPKSMLQKQEEERRQQEKLRKKQEEERRRQEQLLKKQEEERHRQELLLKKQEEERRRQEMRRKKREEERLQREERRRQQKELPKQRENTGSGKSGKRYALIAAAIAVVLAGALLIPRLMPRGDASLSAQETEVPVTEETAPAKTQPVQELSPEAKQYNEAVDFFHNGEYGKAAIAFGKLGDYRDAREISFKIWDAIADRKTIAAGHGFTAAIQENGTVVSCGQYAPNTSDLNDIVSLAASTGMWTLWGLKADGKVVNLKSGTEYDWTNIVAIEHIKYSPEYQRTGLCALRADGRVFFEPDWDIAESETYREKLEQLQDVVSIKSGYFVQLADDTVMLNFEIAEQQDIVAACTTRFGVAMLKRDGTVDFIPENLGLLYNETLTAHGKIAEKMESDIAEWQDIVSICGDGRETVLGIKSDGSVVGTGDTSGANPLIVNKWTDVVAVTASDCHSVGLKSDGTLVTAGNSGLRERQTYGMDNIRLPANRDALLSRIHLEYIADEEVPAIESATFTMASMASLQDGISDTADDPFWGGTVYPRGDITSVTFRRSLADAPEDAWDISESRDRSILAWVTDGNLTVASDGYIALNPDSSDMFYNFKNLTGIDFGDCTDTAQVTDMSRMFMNCYSLQALDLSSFNTAKVTDMSEMFSSCSMLKTLDISSFDTANVTTMEKMFHICNSIQTLDLRHFNTGNVTTMHGMFWECFHLNDLNISNFDTSSVTTMSSMFRNCSELTRLDLSGFDTSKVTSMAYMFACCRRLTYVDLSSFDTSSVTKMNHMFEICDALPSLDLSNFDVSNVTDMSQMFYWCSELREIEGVYKLKVPWSADTYKAFYECPIRAPDWA